ncbi:MAG: Fibronectin type domain, partial [Gaiellales bacterium]|nr:Fibronectin type domain [Gaiellales bacterium]
PREPDDFRVVSKTSRSVTLSWRDRAHNERYTDLSAGYASTHELTPVAHWGPLPDVNTVTTYTVTGLRPDIAYEFSIKASNNVGSREAEHVVARTPRA